jgi:hypothetical protein
MANGLCNTITDYAGSQGSLPLFYSIRDCVPMAFSALLFGIFMILFAGQYFLIKNRTGRAKILIALLSSSFVMIPLSMLLALASIVKYYSVMLYAFICIVAFILFVISDNN